MDWLILLPPIVLGATVVLAVLGTIGILLRRRLDRSQWEIQLARSEYGRRILRARRAYDQERAEEEQERKAEDSSEAREEKGQRKEKLRRVLEALDCWDMLTDLRKSELLWGGKYRLGPRVVETEERGVVQVGFALGWTYYTRDFDRYNEVFDFGVWAREEGLHVCVWVGSGPERPTTEADHSSILYAASDHDNVQEWVKGRLLDTARDHLW